MDRIKALNDQVDRLLTGVEPDRHSAGALTGEDRQALRAADALNEMDFSAEMKPRAVRVPQPRAARGRVMRMSGRHGAAPALRWGLAAVVIALAALLVVFREPVAASLGRLFGFAYVPGVGFVSIDAVRVLKNPVTQVNNGRSLSVLRGLSAARDAQLWLEYSDEVRPADGAWLEAPDGRRFDLAWWGWDPDEPGSHGVRLVFPALPADVSQVVLAMPEGWRIPLEWIPASESSLQPANLMVGAPEATPIPGDTTPESAGEANPSAPCAEAGSLRLCVQAAASGAQGLEVLLEALSSGEMKPGMLQDHTLVAWSVGDARLRLLDAQGNQYLPSDQIHLFPYAEERLGEGLAFTGVKGVTGRVRLEVPAVYANLTFSDEIEIDLGADPRDGQEIALDKTVDVAGIPVRFTRALVEEGLPGSLRLKLASEPVETRGGVTPYMLMLGRPEGVDSGYGEGAENGVLTLSVDLMQPTGKLSGVLRLPLLGATVQVSGPFEFTFDVPETQQAAEPTPQVIEGGEFNPLPTGQPLPMDAYQYTGRALQPGDLLAVSVGADASTLYASSGGGSAEPVAALPGQVLAVYPHPDRGGIDYITGALDPDRGNRYEQLYTLRFDQGAPRLLVSAFELGAYNFAWSADGRWLAYLAPRSGPGEGDPRAAHLVDLACREGGECVGQTVPAEANLSLRDLVWSPAEQRLLALGVPQSQSYGASDVYTIYIDPQDDKVYLTNLTDSPTIDDQSAQWAQGGKSVLITCSTAEINPNYYGLCQNDLQVGMDVQLPMKMPDNMRLILASPDGRFLADRLPYYENGRLKLRALDLSSGETRTLVEWPAAKGGFVEPAISPDGQSLGVVEPGMLSALWLSLSGDQSLTVLQAQDPLTWIGWVP